MNKPSSNNNFNKEKYLEQFYEKYASFFSVVKDGNYDIIDLLSSEQIVDLMTFLEYCVWGESRPDFIHFFNNKENWISLFDKDENFKDKFILILKQNLEGMFLRFTMFFSQYLLDYETKEHLFEALEYHHKIYTWPDRPLQNPYLN